MRNQHPCGARFVCTAADTFTPAMQDRVISASISVITSDSNQSGENSLLARRTTSLTFTWISAR